MTRWPQALQAPMRLLHAAPIFVVARRLKKSRGSDDPLAFIDKAKGQQQKGGEGGYDYV